jgi:hypothetical protein
MQDTPLNSIGIADESSLLNQRRELHIRSLCLTLVSQMYRFIVLTCGLLVCIQHGDIMTNNFVTN